MRTPDARGTGAADAHRDELADADAGELRIRVNAHLGRLHINAMGVRAFQDAIAAAIRERRKRAGVRKRP